MIAAGLYTDLHALSALKTEAQKDPASPAALRAAAQQFEALFVNMLFKSMREASLGDDLFGSDQMEFYREMHDQQLALTMAKGEGLGLARMLIEQLGRTHGAAATPEAPSEDARQTTPALPVSNPPATMPIVTAAMPLSGALLGPTHLDRVSTPPIAKTETPSLTAAEPSICLSNPTEFVRSLWPHAVAAAQRLGVRPEVVVAHAALESGWGRGVPQHPDGRSSHNLFGIKADSKWQGARVAVNTLEHEAGAFTRRTESFRAYASLAEGMTNYADFLLSRPRYAAALDAGQDSTRFAHSLSEAGYATDPDYARKLLRVLEGGTLRQAMSGIKDAPRGPITG